MQTHNMYAVRPWFVLAGLALALGGCADGVEMNGKIFDAMGLSPAAQAGAKRETRIAERAPLVLPPSTTRLPEPGTGQQTQVAAVTDQNFPVDPETRNAISAAEKEKEHKAYCSGEKNWAENARKGGIRDKSSSTPTSPYGPCGMFGAATSDIGKDDTKADPLANARSSLRKP